MLTHICGLFSLYLTRILTETMWMSVSNETKTIMFLNIHKVDQVCALQCVIFLLSYFFMLMKLMGSQIVLANELSR